jgi:putative transposase
MTLPRRSQISLDDTPYYHCIARCVRRAFLCGEDHYSGQNFDHRRTWLVDRLRRQSAIFGIDVCAYAIMSNHYHVVLRVDRERVLQWTDQEVIERWTMLFVGPPLIQAARAGKTLNAAQQKTVRNIAAVWRRRLYDLSWFMRCLNESISRQANAEDDCTGRFWEGRFKSQALLDEAAVLSCMAYVDLNPVRARMTSTLAGSDFTSIQARLRQLSSDIGDEAAPKHLLLPFSDGHHEEQSTRVLPFHLKDYIDLVDHTAHIVRRDKRGAISKSPPRLISQLGLTHDQWLALTLEIQSQSLQAIGELSRLECYVESMGRHWIKGQSQLSRLYTPAAA